MTEENNEKPVEETKKAAPKKKAAKAKTGDVNALSEKIIADANAEAKKIIEDAEAQAERIIEAADAVAQQTTSQANHEANTLVESAKDAARAVERDGLKKFWMYKDGESRLFTEGDEIPEGWVDHPDK